MAIARNALVALALIVSVSSVAHAQPVITPGTSRGAHRSDAPRSTEPRPSKEGVDFFEKKIRPVLVKNCYRCHSGDPAQAKSHFVLDTHAGLRKGGDSGAVVEPGHPDKSLLIEAVKYEGLQMPPDGQLPEDVVEDFVKWVELGAPDPRVGKAANPKSKVDLAEARKYWAFQPPKATQAPKVRDTKWPVNDIDRFVLARMEKENLKPVGDADPVTLIRRLTFDLTGLPPTPDEIDAFVKDKSAGRVGAAVDRLLESPRFGERWGRHWLDVARYAESSGKERNIPYRYAWRYRNYVIDSFNADKPYDRFVVEQLAGDIIQARNPGQHENNNLLIATGFLAIGPKSAMTNDPEQFKMDVVDDQIDATGRAFLGMTIACARCHDHKFDPIPQTDYYAMAGIFRSTDTFAGIQPGRRTASETRLIKLAGIPAHAKPSAEDSKQDRDREQQMAKVERQLDNLHKQLDEATKKPTNPPNAKGKKPGQRPVSKAAKVDPRKLRDEIRKEEDHLEELESNAPASDNLAMAVHESSSPADVHVLIRGELKDKGPEVPRGVLTVLKSQQAARIPPKQSGRMELAHWIADKGNPLTARVMVNRVWEHLFGEGLVDTVDNFGAMGNEPSHPDLLDMLAFQFMERKWSVKHLIRTIVLSRAYQLSSEHNDENYEKDPDDKFLWRMRRRRLDAEEIRDAMLMASGQLNLERPEGSPVMELRNWVVNGGKSVQEIKKPTNVRSVYLPILRGIVPDMLGAFDVADPNLIVGKRDVTTVPTQALFLMNNPFVLNQSTEFAQRLLKQPGLDPKAQIDLAYRLALGRAPSDHERLDAAKYIFDFRKSFEAANQKGNANFAGWSSFCQALFECGMFRYVD
jgi:hypothetical protein